MNNFDEQGYPTEEALEAIRKWEITGNDNQKVHDLLDFVEELWYYPEFFCWYKTTILKDWGNADGSKCKVKYRKLLISTGGWSGNEDVIDALHENLMFWMLYWYKTERGGHYWFEIPEVKKFVGVQPEEKK